MASVNYVTIGAVVLIFVLAGMVVSVARAILRRLLGGLDIVSADNRAAVQAHAKQLGRALTLLAYGIAALASVSLALSRVGIGEPKWNLPELGRWLTTHGINVVVIVAGAWVVVRAANLAVEHLQFKLGRHHVHTDLEWQRRASTLGGILTSLVTVVVGFVAILMLLRELSIDVLPILTGAGIAGLAIGFGAQHLVRDVIAGFFLILEDQVRIGDLARINGVTGIVEQINLRTIVLRDGEGAVQVFPNGTITALANLSKQFSYAIIDLRVAYSENIDRVIGTVREVGASMERDAGWGPLLLAPLDVLGIESLDNGGATLRVRFKVMPLHQGKVANELRKRLIGALVGRGIHPYAV
jgi:moderate conductance mechanosensitive channel